ncbi:peptidoglycan/LPS O-acetylase OafA/YrhL [Granulicella aggregans]|uniref:Peptidoglycan/LPS O-acetylase OafA/YrhL n=1 Tax=Granulicella aggregans TaxID=474949 RepID=A0A7W8E4K8_9BACT|nr:peptidoglycan/LPS O-acetylase OafA/YrhL [Granulicella aggregans]
MRHLLFDPFRNEQQAQDRIHLVELDSLRGLAAMSVVLLHFLEGWLQTAPPEYVKYVVYIPLLTSGTAAVMMFFVLSGFVLTLPQMTAEPPGYAAYAIRRVCRIYLPYLAALAFAALCCWRYHGMEMYGEGFKLSWREAPSLPLMAQHIAFLGRYDVYAYNTPVWSLVHEMRISLIFPLLCLVSLRLRPWVAFLIALSLQVAARLIDRFSAPYTGAGYPGVPSIFWSLTIAFCGIFLVGSILARHRTTIVARLERLPSWLLNVLLVVSLGLYQYNAALHIPRFLRDFTAGLGAAYFIMLALVPGGWLSRTLRLRPLRWLGKVSYSLYLIHMPILMLLAIVLYGKVSPGPSVVPFVMLSLLAAAAFHRWVEMPSMRLGRTLAQMVDRRSKSPAKKEADAVNAT